LPNVRAAEVEACSAAGVMLGPNVVVALFLAALAGVVIRFVVLVDNLEVAPEREDMPIIMRDSGD
jgi:hypothetical protein